MDFSIVIVQFVVFIFSVIIHEISHGYIAEILGDDTARREGRLTLNPISHIDPIGSVLLPLFLYFSHLPIIGWAKPVPYNPYNLKNPKMGAGFIAFAGPISNIVFASLFALTLRGLNSVGIENPVVILLFNNIIIINVALAIFNLVPIPPLDGSKVLFALLPHTLIEVQYFLEQYSMILFLLFVFFGFQFIEPLINFILNVLMFHR